MPLRLSVSNRRNLPLLLLIAAAAGLAQTGGKTAAPQRQELQVLFVGNSYTWFNNLPHLVTVLAESAREDRPLASQMIVGGGFTLERHWDIGVAVSALKAESWDYVILQEQSMLGLPPEGGDGAFVLNPNRFYEYARRFDTAIKQAGATPILFLTWARRDVPEMQGALNRAYLHIARELGDRVAPVGMAWQRARHDRPSIRLHQRDNSHPTAAGSYLAACVVYGTLYGKSPEGLIAHIPADGAGIPNRSMITMPPHVAVPLSDVDLSESDARVLQRIAWRAVTDLAARDRRRR